MTPESVVHMLRQMLMTTFWLSAPLLMIGFVAGVVISLIQILTSFQDSAFGTVPRLVAFFLGVFLLLPWMLSRGVFYLTSLLSDLGRYAR